MKILHCCLAAFYIDNYGYQENILPKMHKFQGHDVMILASTETFIDNRQLGYITHSTYYNSDGIKVQRIPYVRYLPHKLAVKLRKYQNTYQVIKEYSPDIIFLHDIQFLDIFKIKEYIENFPKTILYADGHTDFSNSARNFTSRYLLHGLIYKLCAKAIDPFVKCFWGTLPARVEFFLNIYKTSQQKTKLLVMGADDELVKKAKEEKNLNKIRGKYKISADEFLIITGGKIDLSKKQTINLLKAVKQIPHSFKVKMLVFGSVIEELKEDLFGLVDNSIIQFIGWIPSDQTYEYFEAGDLVVFPGRHSVLWEQAVGQGKVCVFRWYSGHTHIDCGGNCEFIYDCSVDEIRLVILKCIKNFNKMRIIAEEKGMEKFSYYKIAERSISE